MLSSALVLILLLAAGSGAGAGQDATPSGSASAQERHLAPPIPYTSLRDGAYYDYPHRYHLYDYRYGFESLLPVPSLVDDPFAYYGSNRNWPPIGNTGHAANGLGLYPVASTSRPDRYHVGHPSSTDVYDDRFYGYQSPSGASGVDLEGTTRPRSLGQGVVRVFGRQAELTCHFPASLNIVSNVIWHKVDRATDHYQDVYQPHYDGYGDRLGSDGRVTIRQYPTGSTLYVSDFGARDFGVYRCSASQGVYVNGRPTIPTTRTVYQNVYFDGMNHI